MATADVWPPVGRDLVFLKTPVPCARCTVPLRGWTYVKDGHHMCSHCSLPPEPDVVSGLRAIPNATHMYVCPHCGRSPFDSSDGA